MIKSDIALLSNTHEELRLRGMVIVGTPVGSFDFCQWFVKKNLSTMMQESQTLKDLHPQCAVKLLKECVCAAPGYLSQVCHPNLTKEFLLEFDDNVWKLCLQFIGGVGDEQLKCCHEGLSRARGEHFSLLVFMEWGCGLGKELQALLGFRQSLLVLIYLILRLPVATLGN